MKKKNVKYKLSDEDSSLLQEPALSYRQDVVSREIPEQIMWDIEVSREEYKKGLAIPVDDFMKKYRNGCLYR